MFPISLTLADRRVVVAGGGAVAERKVHALRAAGADVTVISPELTPELTRLAETNAIAWIGRLFAFGDCAGALLAFAATDDGLVNAAVVVDARQHGVLVCDTSDAERGDFITPAVHRAGNLTVTVDSAGLSPSFTARIRDELAVQFDARYARAAATLGALRERVLAVVPIERRADVMRHFAERDIDDLAAMPAGAVEHEVERAVDTLGGVKPSDLSTLVCATRASALAMWQTRSVMAQLAAGGIPSTVLSITTKGDAVLDRSIAAVGENVFVKELETALRVGRADYAVHSCKDLPSTLPDDMAFAAIAQREDPRDTFCSDRYETFEELPPGARVRHLESAPARAAARVAPRSRVRRYSRKRRYAAAQTARGRVRCDRAGGSRTQAPRTLGALHGSVCARRARAGGRARRARDRDARRRSAHRTPPQPAQRPAHRTRGAGGARVLAHHARRLSGTGRRACRVRR